MIIFLSRGWDFMIIYMKIIKVVPINFFYLSNVSISRCPWVIKYLFFNLIK